MATEIKLWHIEDGKPTLSEIDMIGTGRKETDDLEKWIKNNPEILGKEVIIIGEQIMTKRGSLDFLGIDREGDLIVIELKRDKLHREVLAQAIDYASDLSSWDLEKLNVECEKYNGKKIEECLTENFDLDEESIEVNTSQRILLVGTGVDESLQRMVEWLSNNYDLGINVLILKYTKTKNGDEILARTAIIPEEIEQEKDQRRQRKIYPRHISRKEFWTELLEKINKKTKLHSGNSPTIYSWIAAGAGKSGITYNYWVSNDSVGAEIYLDREKEVNKKRFDDLFKYKEEIENKFGEELDWRRLDHRKASKITFVIDGGLRNRERWGELQDKMIDTMIRLEKTFKEYIPKIE